MVTNFADDIFISIFLYENIRIVIRISVNLFPVFDDTPALV